jgi:hypothetical protein
LWRSRWAAIGAAVAVTFGAGGLVAVNAAGGVDSTTVLTDPVRVLDSRDPVNVGLAGPFASQAPQKLKVTGSIVTTTGTKTVVPTGATGVLLNVTAVAPSAAGFISIRPGDAAGLPSTSSLNFTAGQIVPNAVLVALPTGGANAGQIDITYDAFGASGPTTDILIDVVGYTNNSTLAALQAEINAVEAANATQQTQINGKANSADVYTKAQVDAGFVPQGEIVMRHSLNDMQEGGNGSPTIKRYANETRFSVAVGVQYTVMGLDGPKTLGGVEYGLKSVNYCISGVGSPAVIDSVTIHGEDPHASASDLTDRSGAGCHTITVNNSTSTSFKILVFFKGGSGYVALTSVTSTWAPTASLPLMAQTTTAPGPDTAAP